MVYLYLLVIYDERKIKNISSRVRLTKVFWIPDHLLFIYQRISKHKYGNEHVGKFPFFVVDSRWRWINYILPFSQEKSWKGCMYQKDNQKQAVIWRRTDNKNSISLNINNKLHNTYNIAGRQGYNCWIKGLYHVLFSIYLS